ncbi:ArsC/Spx/MgsR family protein [Ruminococcus sp. FC2018]|uniref:arsenate reductase family protein n=1 Tax=Ruminococcus sp. FC2018 TaxID=1410617 RepID=UPI000490542B|nr:ArsC/Spx/MgsR family protein [Ruminococcus sp. FC2018]
MNIQIFGRSSSFDTKKAQRYFKERRISFQYIDLNSKGMSKGEFTSVLAAVGDIDKLLDPKAKGEAATLFRYLGSAEEKQEKLLENPQIITAPVVRNGKHATVGYCPDVWKNWE